MFGFFKRRRRRKILAEPFPDAWENILRKNFPLYLRLSDADRRELRDHIRIFIAEKNFEGAGELQITDEIRVTIAAQACMLLLHRESDYYPRLRSIIVYPHAFVSQVREQASLGVVSEREVVRLGEAWGHGTVVLAWDHTRSGAADIRDGHNVVFHEFAHQLDQESGDANGAPVLERSSMYVAWARVLGEAYARLQKDSGQGRSSVLDSYGATNPAEFFAVATEAFFEKPCQLRRSYPELYDELKMYYQQDPEEFFEHPEQYGAGDHIAGSGDVICTTEKQ